MRRVSTFCAHSDGLFAICAPTYAQVKRIYWDRIRKLFPPWLIERVSETTLEIRLVTGAIVMLVGMDKPSRIEGIHLDGALLDEVDDMKPDAWVKSVRPCLGTEGREGWAIFIGRPRGRKMLYRLYRSATEGQNEDREDEEQGEWAGFHWSSRTVLDPREIAAMERDMDPASVAQEIDASFVNLAGRTYYPFRDDVHARHELSYRPGLALAFCFDFNVSPGVALATQEQVQPDEMTWSPIVFDERRVVPRLRGRFTACLSEVWVPNDSNSRIVARRLVREWGSRHQGMVYLYGDATGGQRRSSATEGNDWALILEEVRQVPGWHVRMRVHDANPAERARVNATNCRLMASDGTVRTLIDPRRCPHLIEDLQGVTSDEGGSIEKIQGDPLTHLSDAFGYRVEHDFPAGSHELVVTQV